MLVSAEGIGQGVCVAIASNGGAGSIEWGHRKTPAKVGTAKSTQRSMPLDMHESIQGSAGTGHARCWVTCLDILCQQLAIKSAWHCMGSGMTVKLSHA